MTAKLSSTDRPVSVLLVESDWAAALDRTDALVRSGWHVDVASSASQALTALERSSKGTPDAIVIELVLDGAVSGLDLAREVSRIPALRSVPVIGLTSLPIEEIAPLAKSVGCVACLATFCAPEAVIAAVEEARYEKSARRIPLAS